MNIFLLWTSEKKCEYYYHFSKADYLSVLVSPVSSVGLGLYQLVFCFLLRQFIYCSEIFALFNTSVVKTIQWYIDNFHMSYFIPSMEYPSSSVLTHLSVSSIFSVHLKLLTSLTWPSQMASHIHSHSLEMLFLTIKKNGDFKYKVKV